MTLGCESSEWEALGFIVCRSLSLEDGIKWEQEHKQPGLLLFFWQVNRFLSVLTADLTACSKLLVLEIRCRNSLAVQWLGLHAVTAKGPGSIPGRGTTHKLRSMAKTTTNNCFLFFVFFKKMSNYVFGMTGC